MNACVHYVKAYIHEQDKEFTTTARTKAAGLDRVDQQMRKSGYNDIVVGQGLSKDEANALKLKTNEEWERKGYVYQTRDRF